MRLIALLFLSSLFLYSKGTLSGESISNKASISFKLNNTSYIIRSNQDEFVVDRVVDIKLYWQDLRPIGVSSNEQNRVLSFVLANLGNAKEEINLEKIVDQNKTFLPAPNNIRLYEDSNHNGVFDKNDTQSSKKLLEADENTTLFIVADIPDGNQSINATSYVGINASIKSFASNQKDKANKIDTVIRNNKASAFGIYKIRDCWLEATHKGKVLSQDNKAHTGSIIEYTIKLSIGGNNKGKVIKDISFKDSIPAKSLYIPNSLTLNNEHLSDSEHIKGSSIIINNLTISNDETYTITFKVQIQ